MCRTKGRADTRPARRASRRNAGRSIADVSEEDDEAGNRQPHKRSEQE